METELNLIRMCRHCGALLKDAGECWFCHRTLNYDDIVHVERRLAAQREGGVPKEHWTEVPATGPQGQLTEAVKDVAVGSSARWGAVYDAGAWITGVIVFFISWIYAVIAYGLFIGLGLGWIPSLVIALIAGLLWPLIAIVIAVIAAVVVFYAVSR